MSRLTIQFVGIALAAAELLSQQPPTNSSAVPAPTTSTSSQAGNAAPGRASIRNPLTGQPLASEDKDPPTSAATRARLAEQLNYTHQAGLHSRLSPVVGSRAHELDLVFKTIEKNPALLEFGKEIYRPERVYLIPKEQRNAADVVARQLYNSYVAKYKSYGVTPDNAVASMASGMPGAGTNKTFIYDIENQSNTWRAHAVVEAQNGIYNEREGGYVPPDVAKYHELMHVEETPKGAPPSFQGRVGAEILTTTKTILLEDEIYKKINGIPMDRVVDYRQTLHLGGRDVPLGEVANFYRVLEKKYGNLAKAITSGESLEFVATGFTPPKSRLNPPAVRDAKP